MRFTRPAIRDWKTLWRELLVTFVGVLLALVVSAWWTGRQDRARERAYMRQITADIDRSLAASNLPAAIAAESKAARANVALLRAFRAPVPPPADSIARWLYDAEDYKAFTPFTGTARAMLSTGDINLIHNDSVRAIIVAMVGTVDELTTRTHDDRLKWQAQAEDLERNTDYIELTADVLGPAATDSTARADPNFGVPPGRRRIPFPATDYIGLLRNRDVYRALVKMNTAHRSTLEILKQELNGLHQIRGLFARDI